MRRSTIFCVAPLLLGVALPAGAQSDAPSGTIIGRIVVGADSSHVVPDAEVTLQSVSRSVRSDSAGRFRFRAVPSGEYVVRVRHVGFDVALEHVSVGDGTTSDVEIAMTAAPHVLGEAIINGKRVLYPMKYAEAYARMARGGGAFFPRERIDSLAPADLMDLLTNASGVHVNRGKLTFSQCRTGSALAATSRVQVYLNGSRETQYLGGVGGFDVNEAVKGVPLSSIEVVEVFQGALRIPFQYADDACAVVLIWTR